MNFNSHDDLLGKHAFLSASKYSWIRYDDEKLVQTWWNSAEAARGTRLHEFAAEAIRLKVPLRSTKQTLNMFVNDAIRYGMTPEQVLFYSYNAFGTADAISFKRNLKTKRMLLRIHDLKNGRTKASINQLEIYAAFFCLEYDENPFDIDILLQIYQNDYIQVYEPDPKDIIAIMEKTVDFDELINTEKMEVGL